LYEEIRHVNGFVLVDNHRGEDRDYEWYSSISGIGY
jgi:hypothetical protein